MKECNGYRYVACRRCEGYGMTRFRHVNGGVCFACNGRGHFGELITEVYSGQRDDPRSSNRPVKGDIVRRKSDGYQGEVFWVKGTRLGFSHRPRDRTVKGQFADFGEVDVVTEEVARSWFEGRVEAEATEPAPDTSDNDWQQAVIERSTFDAEYAKGLADHAQWQLAEALDQGGH